MSHEIEHKLELKRRISGETRKALSRSLMKDFGMCSDPQEYQGSLCIRALVFLLKEEMNGARVLSHSRENARGTGRDGR